MLLIPEPRKIKLLKGTCPIQAEVTVTLGANDLPPQGYRLSIKANGVQIAAADEAGAFYAHQTLEQILAQHDGPEVPCQRIEDWPDFINRGYMLDISRDRVPTMAHLCHLVDCLAQLRYNQLQLYTEHTFAYAGHETVWGMASPLTPEEIEALDAYCAERHIELVPNQNSFGHMERWLKHPEYKELAECPDGFSHPITGSRDHGTTLKPDELSLQFLNELYGDLLPHFTSRQFNIGGDEPWELGQGWSAPQIEAESKHVVYARFLRRICELAQSHGYAPMCWADILLEDPLSINELPEQVIPLIWGYEANHPFDQQCAIIASTDRPFYVVPGDSSWNSFTGRVRNMLENIRSAARHGLRHQACGILLTQWGDHGHPQTWPVTLPGMVAGALFSWHGDANGNLDLATQLNCLFFQDEDCQAANVLLEMGDVDRLLPLILGNQSFLCTSTRLPLADLQKRLTDCPAEALQNVVNQTWEWETALQGTTFQASDGEALREEMNLAIGLTRFAAQRCLAIKAHDGVIEDFRLGNALRADLSFLIGQYEKVWIRRSRIGGLHESASRLRRMLA